MLRRKTVTKIKNSKIKIVTDPKIYKKNRFKHFFYNILIQQYDNFFARK